MVTIGIGSRRLALAGAIVALATVLPQGPRSRAADYAALSRQVSQAIAATQSNKMVMDMSIAGIAQHVEIIAVGRGAGKSYYIKQIVWEKTGNRVEESVLTSKRSCVKMQTTWRCTPITAADNARGAFNNPFEYARTEEGATMSINALGSRTIQGQRCTGYRIILTGDETRQIGEFWINAASKLPVQFDLKTSEKPAVAMRMVWSHWNDPALRLPPVKS